jgi:hypothetical protein
MVASIDSEETDVVVISALPPKASLHARYLLKLIQSRSPEQRIIAGLWTNDKASSVELNQVKTATTLDALQDQLDQITPMMLLAKTPARDPKNSLVMADKF